MLRCASALTLALTLALPAAAQLQRPFDHKTLRGTVVFDTPPQATLNGKPVRLAPGARVRDEGNLVQLPVTLVGRKAVVHYTTDLEGQLLDVWILTPQEQAKKPWPVTQQEAQAWVFDANAQAWTRR
jgi:hypothetical protein